MLTKGQKEALCAARRRQGFLLAGGFAEGRQAQQPVMMTGRREGDGIGMSVQTCGKVLQRRHRPGIRAQARKRRAA